MNEEFRTDSAHVFDAYAAYYDLLYSEKDYTGEVDYVHRVLQARAPGAKSVLDLGCGTGRHAVLLCERGYEVTGIDLSHWMVDLGQARLASMENGVAKPRLLQGDIRNTRLQESFDVVVSLFHVMSYQTTNEDLQAAFATASVHLKPGGVFFFDCWFGPAVLSEKPTVRVKRFSNDEVEIVRVAEPVLRAEENVVEVNYQLLVRDRSSGRQEEIRECHRLRYLFVPELQAFLGGAGMEMEGVYEWMTEAPPAIDSWNVCLFGRKR